MMTLEACERVATKSGELLSKPIFKVADSMVQAMRSVLIRQIALADRIGAMIRDFEDTEEIEIGWQIMENLLRQSVRLSIQISQKARG